MAKEKFLIVAVHMPDDCFPRFSEPANRAAISAGTADPNDPYSWIEASFEIQLRRWREATHICSFTPSARYTWLANAFVGVPNAAWEEDGDPDGLENESGGEPGGYGTYEDNYDKRFICDSFVIDSMNPDHLNWRARSNPLGPMRQPRASRSLSRRTGKQAEALERYTDIIWEAAEESAWEISRNGLSAPILDVMTFRKWERERRPMRFVGDKGARP